MKLTYLYSLISLVGLLACENTLMTAEETSENPKISETLDENSDDTLAETSTKDWSVVYGDAAEEQSFYLNASINSEDHRHWHIFSIDSTGFEITMYYPILN